jgi:uncharacterized protein (DUF433 family)
VFTLNEKEIKNLVENFKGLTWEELDDALECMDKDDMESAIRMLKARYG